MSLLSSNVTSGLLRALFPELYQQYTPLQKESESVSALQDAQSTPSPPCPPSASMRTLLTGTDPRTCMLYPFRIMYESSASYRCLFRCLTSPHDRIQLTLACVLAVLAGLPLPVIGVIFSRIINQFPPPEDALRSHLLQLIGVGSAYFLVTAGYTILWGCIGERITRQLRQDVVKRLLAMDLSYHDLYEPTVSNLLTEKMESIQIGTSEKVGIFIQTISYFVAAVAVAIILNPVLTAALLAFAVPAVAAITWYGSRAGMRFSRRTSRYSRRAARLAQCAIHCVGIVQAFGLIDELTTKHLCLLRRKGSYALKSSTTSALMLGSVLFVAYAANALAFYLGSRMAAGSSQANAGSVYAVVFLILDATLVLGQFGPFLGAFSTAAAAGSEIFAIIDGDDTVISKEDSNPFYTDPSAFEQEVELRNVSFGYPSRPSAKALEDINLKIRPGTLNALVGHSGSGKSTVLALILRLYDVASGKISIGGEDVRSYNASDLRRYIAFLGQESSLFNASILDNIRYGLLDESLSDSEVFQRCNRAAIQAGVDFMNRLPLGIRSEIGSDSGVQLSGGEKQRICLARALVKQPKILLLDEPTSGLDAHNEAMIMRTIKSLADRGCTVVMATHRLSTVMDFENLAFMANGKLVEEGSHLHLMKSNISYKDMFDAQMPTELAQRVSQLVATHARPSHSMEEESANDTLSFETSSDEARASIRPLTTLDALRRCIGMDRTRRYRLYLGLLCSVASGSIVVGEAINFGHLVQLLNFSSDQTGFLRNAEVLSLFFLLLAVIALAAHGGSGSAFGSISAHFVTQVEHASLTHILRQDMAWFTTRSGDGLMANLQSDAAQLSCLSGVALGTICAVATSLVGGITLSLFMAWKIAIVLLCAVPVMVGAGFARLKILAVSETRNRAAYGRASALAIEGCRHIRTVTALGHEKRLMAMYREALVGPHRSAVKFTIASNLILALSLSITYFIYALAYWWGAKLVRQGQYSTEDFFIVLPALLFSAQSTGQVFGLSPEISKATGAAKRVFELHDEQPTILVDNEDDNTSELEDASTAHLLGSMRSRQNSGSDEPTHGHIEIHNLSLKYPGREQWALRNIKLEMNPGETIALVGRSGSGKSSLISLLERFYDPSSGSILIAGTDLRSIPVAQHRARVGLVPQQSDLFPGSLRYNISLGAIANRETPSLEQIERVSSQCGIHKFITSLPEGYDTECGSNGSKLSGGQKQRIAIARALIRRPRILLLDECTSGLDADTEREVLSAITDDVGDRITIMVTHHLWAARVADRILVLHEGRVVQDGTHTELEAVPGLYSDMCKKQGNMTEA